MKNVTTSKDLFTKEIQEFNEILNAIGVMGALRFLNKRTPHRFTGLYRYDGEILRNIFLYDKYNPYQNKGEDAPLGATYCSMLKNQGRLEINDALDDNRVKGIIITPVISYCGVLMRDSTGNPFGSLCNFDMNRCQERTTDIPLLKSASELLYNYLYLKTEKNQ